MSAETQAGPLDPKAAIAALEAQLAAIPRASRPHEHATVAYRLGLAYAESPVGSHEDSLRKALACYQVAAAIFDPRLDPVEHARVLNVAGAAHRALGDRRRAATLFQEATRLLADRDRDDERAAAFNNLGLVRAEMGQATQAVAACDEALELFDTVSAEGRRGRVAALHTRGQANSSLGTEAGLEAALADFEAARATLDLDDAPYHDGLVHHSIGITCSALAALRPGERERLLDEAVRAFSHTLRIFTRTSFPFQHALAKHNLGRAHAALGGVVNLRRALAGFEDAVGMLDTRVHADAWKQAYASLSATEAQLAELDARPTLAAHFAAMVVELGDEDRRSMLRDRLTRLLAQPQARRMAALTDLAVAVAEMGEEAARLFLEAQLGVLMEIGVQDLEANLRAIVDGHRRLGEDAQLEADAALDRAVSDALVGPQRISVRDFLYSIDWERP